MGQRTIESRMNGRKEILNQLADMGGKHTRPLGVSRAQEALLALRRLDDGNYGLCIDCDDQIPEQRLQIKPEATRCVNCQQEFEQYGVAWVG